MMNNRVSMPYDGQSSFLPAAAPVAVAPVAGVNAL